MFLILYIINFSIFSLVTATDKDPHNRIVIQQLETAFVWKDLKVVIVTNAAMDFITSPTVTNVIVVLMVQLKVNVETMSVNVATEENVLVK